MTSSNMAEDSTDVGPVGTAVPRDREGSFEPRIVKKLQECLTEFTGLGIDGDLGELALSSAGLHLAASVVSVRIYHACQLGDLGAITQRPVLVQGGMPEVLGHGPNCVADRLGDGVSDREEGTGSLVSACHGRERGRFSRIRRCRCGPGRRCPAGGRRGSARVPGRRPRCGRWRCWRRRCRAAAARTAPRRCWPGNTARGVGGGVAARVPGPQQRGDRLSGPAVSVVDEPHQRVMAEGLLPGRLRVLLVGVRDHQHSVQVHDHLAFGVRGRVTGHLPDVLAHLGAGCAERALPPAARVSISRDTVGSEATGPNTAGSARSMPTSARQSPPSRPPAPHPAGSCPDRAPPEACATAPAPPISPHPDRSCGSSPPATHRRPGRPPHDRRLRYGHAGRTRYASSPWRVLLSSQPTGPSASPIVAGQEHFPLL